jgi:hypothetical protein
MDWFVVIGCGVVGWLLVNYLFSRTKPKEQQEEPWPPQSADPRSAHDPAGTTARLPAPPLPQPAETTSNADLHVRPVPTPTSSDSGALSLDEVARAWHTILGVSSDASGAEIERAYHAKLADCDRVRFTVDIPEATKRRAEEQRARVSQAFEFIRPLRS